MTEKEETILVHANVEISPAALQSIVKNAKKITLPDKKGVFRVDTADMVSQIISRFLAENDFESYTKDLNNYS